MFPQAIDSTIISAFTDCPQKAKYSYIDNKAPSSPNIDLVAGAAFAKGVEVARRRYCDGLTANDSLARGVEALIIAYGDADPGISVKTLERTCEALSFYFEEYPLETDLARIAIINGVPAVEMSFAVPLPINHPDTNEPLLYCGRIDCVVLIADGIYCIDEKTTTRLGAQWQRNWDLRGQLTGYCWALREVGVKAQGTIIRGVSFLKDRYETTQVVVSQPDWRINVWYSSLLAKTHRMVEAYKNKVWERALGEACNLYSGCPFRDCCLSRDPDSYLQTYFIEHIWEPLAKR